MGYDPVLVRVSKSPLIKRLTRFVLAGWLVVILLWAFGDPPIHNFWPKLLLPLGYLLTFLNYVRTPPTKKHRFLRWELFITLVAYDQTLTQRDLLSLATFVVYGLLSLGIVLYIFIKIYWIAEKQPQSPADKELQTHEEAGGNKPDS
jgi:hypothetical protein